MMASDLGVWLRVWLPAVAVRCLYGVVGMIRRTEQALCISCFFCDRSFAVFPRPSPSSLIDLSSQRRPFLGDSWIERGQWSCDSRSHGWCDRAVLNSLERGLRFDPRPPGRFGVLPFLAAERGSLKSTITHPAKIPRSQDPKISLLSTPTPAGRADRSTTNAVNM